MLTLAPSLNPFRRHQTNPQHNFAARSAEPFGRSERLCKEPADLRLSDWTSGEISQVRAVADGNSQIIVKVGRQSVEWDVAGLSTDLFEDIDHSLGAQIVKRVYVDLSFHLGIRV